MIERGLRLLALLPFDRLDHPAHAEQRIETRRLQAGQIVRPRRHGPRLAERRLVQPDLHLPAFALDPQIDGAIAAREFFLREAARPDLEPLEA